MMKSRPTIERVEISGFKSIRHAEIEFNKLNVLIGANGSGKSNLVSFFEMLRAALDAKLDGYVGRHGGPNAFLHLGSKVTDEISAAITVQTEVGTGTLHQRLAFRAPDTLAYSPPHTRRPKGADRSNEVVFDDLCSVIKHGRKQGHPGHLIYESLKDRIGVYHFHDTTLSAAVRMAGYIEDNQALRGDAGNLAAMLYRYKKTEPETYELIVDSVRLIAPFFDDFVLEPQRLNPRNILLNWRARETDYPFGPHQLSDGTIRAMALATLLLQPRGDLPDLIVIDEPELGLHPYALSTLAALLQSASANCQILVATQSVTLLDEFDPTDVIVVDRQSHDSVFSRPDPDKLRGWLEDYSLGDVWWKNVIGGGPKS